MDINKFKESVEKSHLSDETKDLIYILLNDSDNPDSWQQITEAIDFETEMNENVANEARELIDLANEQEKMIDAAEDSADEEMNNLEEDVNDEIANIDAETQQLSSDDGSVTDVDPEPVASMQQSAPVPTWNQPTEPVAPVQQPQTSWSQPAQNTAPTTATPWNQPSGTTQVTQ